MAYSEYSSFETSSAEQQASYKKAMISAAKSKREAELAWNAVLVYRSELNV